MKIENICFYDENFKKQYGNISFDEKITDIEITGKGTDDYFLIPGFIDIHTHGAIGIDWCDGNNFDELLSYYLSHGVTSLCPTTMTLPVTELIEIAKKIEEYKGKEKGTYIHGINLEGPFVSKEKCGAQNPEYIVKPNYDDYEKIEKVSHLSLIDVAPEIEGAIDFSVKASKTSTVSIAHTNAEYIDAKKALENGFLHATHLFNAMTSMTHRSPGVVGAVLENDECTAELICDGFHINPAVIKVAFKTLGKNRPCVISDSLSCAGMGDCEFQLGGQKVILKNGEARLEDGTIAGSTTNIHSEFKNLIDFGIGFESALRACSINPARAIKVENKCGSISVGKNADMILMDKKLNILKVYVKGEEYDEGKKK